MDTQTRSQPLTRDTASSRQLFHISLLVFGCAFVVRLIVLLQFREFNPLFEHPVVDAWKYDALARELLRTGSWAEPGAFHQPPAYPFFLAIVYKIFGGSYTWVRVVQAVMGSLSCVFIALIGSIVHSRRIGLTGGLIGAFYGPLIFFDLDLLAPVLIIFWSTLGLLLLATGLQRSSRPLLFVAGLGFGLALISWPIIGLACALTVLLILWSCKTMPRKGIAMALLFSLGVLIPITPVFLHNVKKGEMALVSTNGGINFYIGNNPDWQETVAMRPGYPWEKIVTLPNHLYGVEEVEKQGSSALFFQEAKKYILSNPWAYVRNQLVKLYQVCFGYEIMRNTDLYFFKQYSSLLDHLVFSRKWLKFPYGLLFPLAVLGLYYSRRTTTGENRYLVAYLAATTAGLFLFFVTSRYRVVLIPVLAVYASIGLCELPGGLRRRKKHALASLALLFGLIPATNLDLLDQQKHFESGMYQAQAPFTLGRVSLDRGNYEQALEWLQKSVSIDPSYPDAWVDLGRARYALGDIRGAVEAMEKAIRAAPDYPLPYYNLGLIHDGPSYPPSMAINYYRQFLSRSRAYYDSRIRGPGRINFVRKRLNELVVSRKEQ